MWRQEICQDPHAAVPWLGCVCSPSALLPVADFSGSISQWLSRGGFGSAHTAVLPSTRLRTLGSEALAGWAGPALQSQNQRGQQQRLPQAQIIPVPACGRTWRVPDRRRSSLGGLLQKQRKLHPLPGAVLCRALHSLRNGNHVCATRRAGHALCPLGSHIAVPC